MKGSYFKTKDQTTKEYESINLMNLGLNLAIITVPLSNIFPGLF